MANNLEQLFREARENKFPVKEKLEVRETLATFIDYNPKRAPATGVAGSWSWAHLFRLQSVGVALLVLILAGGGISLAAEGAVPGELLYSVKVELNENIRGWFAISEESQIKWQARRVERRLDEVTELSIDGRLDSQKREVIEAELEGHIRNFEASAAKLEKAEKNNEAAEANSALEVSLKNHEKVLSDIAEEKKELGLEIQPILQKVRASAAVAGREKTRVAAKIATSTKDIGGEVTGVENEKEQKIEPEKIEPEKQEPPTIQEDNM